ncbi:uncharacterized protein LOC126095724 isoform X2 [Schistocerca cancellata]|uniref:uncharacterized protein LOC126095724 isoform X2 n=1 Tax=Schistocerca cancellata TaxID=274614 RepID=UPI002118B9B2|nr:uncharacterized protein LOC126095724 isoform X2 [Schistocerca cancellata]
MASSQEQASLSDLVLFQAQQMTQLLAAVNGLITLQAAAAMTPPTPPPVPTPTTPPALPFRAFNPDVECWPEYIAQLEAHFGAYNITELEASWLPPPQTTTPLMTPPPLAPKQQTLLPPPPLSVRSPAPGERLSPPPWPHLRPPPSPPPPPCSSAVPELMDTEAAVMPPPPLLPMEAVAPCLFIRAYPVTVRFLGRSPPREQFGDLGE